MLNHRLAALLVLITCVILPMLFYWLTSPGITWVRPYIIWGMVIFATWLWQRRRGTL
ncbi:MAG: hypothetical protein WC997_10175 [Porticoccaceae bacterium]